MSVEPKLLARAALVPLAGGVAGGGDKQAALADYLAGGPAAGGETVDEDYYRARYPDVAATGASPRQHFFDRGAREGRFPDLRHEAAAAAALFASGTVRPPDGLASAERRDHALRALRDGPKQRYEAKVDLAFVRDYHPYGLLGVGNAARLVQWLTEARQEARDGKRTIRMREAILASGAFDAEEYRARVILPDPRLGDAIDPVTYYLTEGWRRLLSPSGFSDLAYLSRHPDILRAGVPPLYHFLSFGRAEGRVACTGARAISAVAADRHPGRLRVLLVTHEAGRSGAPLLALELCRRFAREFDVTVLSLHAGVLDAAFAEAAGAYHVLPAGAFLGRELDALIDAAGGFDAVVVNTLACGDAVAECAARGLPVLTMVHDFPTHVWPPELVGRALLHSEAIVFPARVVRDDVFRAARDQGLDLSPDFATIRHQGRIPAEPKSDPDTLSRLDAFVAGHSANGPPLVILGAGAVQRRKGVTLFVDACAHALRLGAVNCVFVWVGGGYDPAGGDEQSVFLTVQAEKQGIGDRLLFLGETTDFEAVIARGHGFVLSSLLDPFPNVAIDALAHGLRLVCFEGATGIADLAEDFPAAVATVSYRDTAALGGWIAALEGDPAGRDRAPDPALLARFDRERYADAAVADVRRIAATPILADPLDLAQRFDFDAVRTLPEMRFACGAPPLRHEAANVARTFVQLARRHRTLGRGGGAGSEVQREVTLDGLDTITLHYRSLPLLSVPRPGGAAPLRLDPIGDGALWAVLAGRFPTAMLPGLPGGLPAAIGGSVTEIAPHLALLLNAVECVAGGVPVCLLTGDDLSFATETAAAGILVAGPEERMKAIDALAREPDRPDRPLHRLIRLARACGAEFVVPVERDLFPLDIRMARPIVDVAPPPGDPRRSAVSGL